MQLGRLLAGNSDKSANLRVVRQLAAKHPKLAQAQFAIAQAALVAGDDDAALAAARGAAAMRPEWEPPAVLEAQVLQKRSPAAAAQAPRGFRREEPRLARRQAELRARPGARQALSLQATQLRARRRRAETPASLRGRPARYQSGLLVAGRHERLSSAMAHRERTAFATSPWARSPRSRSWPRASKWLRAGSSAASRWSSRACGRERDRARESSCRAPGRARSSACLRASRGFRDESLEALGRGGGRALLQHLRLEHRRRLPFGRIAAAPRAAASAASSSPATSAACAMANCACASFGCLAASCRTTRRLALCPNAGEQPAELHEAVLEIDAVGGEQLLEIRLGFVDALRADEQRRRHLQCLRRRRLDVEPGLRRLDRRSGRRARFATSTARRATRGSRVRFARSGKFAPRG